MTADPGSDDWHGTKQWQRHRKEGTPLCERCRQFRNNYIRDYRHSTGQSKGTWIYVPDPEPLTADHYQI